jgi:hypothetical protein
MQVDLHIPLFYGSLEVLVVGTQPFWEPALE